MAPRGALKLLAFLARLGGLGWPTVQEAVISCTVRELTERPIVGARGLQKSAPGGRQPALSFFGRERGGVEAARAGAWDAILSFSLDAFAVAGGGRAVRRFPRADPRCAPDMKIKTTPALAALAVC